MYTRRETCLIASRLVSSGLFFPAVFAAHAQGARQSSPTTDALTIPFFLASGRGSLLIRARINRRDALLIVDTGSSHTILQPAVAGVNPTELAAPRVGPGIMGDAVGQDVTLEVGPHISQRRVSVMDLSSALSVYQERIDGLLGIDFLMDFSQTVINLKDRVITFVR
jgi:Aspartyl protease